MELKSTFKPILKLTGLKIIGLFLGLCYSILQVRYFGASKEMDAFFLATSLIYIIISLTQGGQIAEVFLPEYLNVKSEYGTHSAGKLFSMIITHLTWILVVFLAIVYFISPILIKVLGQGFEKEFIDLSLNLFRLSLPIIFFTIISSFINVTLNAERIFGRAELTGIINSVISLSILFIFKNSLGVKVLVYALLAGKIVEIIIGIIFLRKLNWKYEMVWRLHFFNTKKFVSFFSGTTFYVISTQAYNSALIAMSSYLPSGIFSIFNYVKDLSSKFSRIILGPVSVVFFTDIASLVTKKSSQAYKKFHKILISIFPLFVIFFVGTILIGEEFLKLIWTERKISESYYDYAHLMLLFNFAGFIFSSQGIIFRKTAISLGAGKKLYINWSIAQLITLVYTILAIYYFESYGLSTVLLVNMILLSSVSLKVLLDTDIGFYDYIRKAYFSLYRISGFFIIIVICFLIDRNYEALELNFINSLLLKLFIAIIVVGAVVFYMFKDEKDGYLSDLKTYFSGKPE